MSSDSSYYFPDDLIDKRYLVENVKRGSMGVVYLCVDQNTSRPIALKTFQNFLLKTGESRQRFFEEALLWIELGKHPCIVQAFGLRLIEEKPYLLVERIQSKNPRGVTLKDTIFTQTLTLEFMLQTSIYLCSAMNHAVNQFPNFVHGDLKPENILLGDDFVAKLTDFGIATHMHHVETNTSSLSPYELATRMEGTPAFASPEQCRLQKLDTRSDIYSFGCIMYQMVTKQVPFMRVEVADYIHAHLHHKPKPLEIFDPSIPHSISQLVLTCLEKQPHQRYQTFLELQYELEQIYRNYYNKSPKTFHASDALDYEERIERAWSFALVGRYKQAEKEFETTRRLFGEQPGIHEHLARFYFAKQNYTKARNFLVQALDSNPNHEELLELKAIVCIENKEWKEAELSLRRAISINPKRKQSYLYLADVYEKRGKDRQCELLYTDAVEVCDYDPDIVNRYIDRLFLKRKHTHIKSLITKSLEKYQGHPKLLLRLSQVYAANRERRRALSSLHEAIQSNPDTFDFWRDAGEVYYQLGDYNEAYDAFNNALLYDHGDGEFYSKMAEMSFNLRRYDDAWRLAERAEQMGVNVSPIKNKIKKNRFSV